MTQTTAPPQHEAPSPTPDPAEGGDHSWRFFLRRFLVIGLASFVTVVLLVFLIAWLALRVDWRLPDPAALSGPTVVYAADGTELARFDNSVDRRIVPLRAVSQAAQDAVIASEDVRFYEHDGVDPLSLLRAVAVNVRTGGIEQGGSTLTQQYVKNAYTTGDRSIQRKVQEAVLSISLERKLSKDEILGRYLNQVYFGEGAYGIEAAALTYFGVPASQLTVAQGATLAQLLPAPSARNPRVDPDGAVQRRNRVIDQMLGAGFITPAAARDARAAEVEILPREPVANEQPFFVEYVRKQLVAAFGEKAVATGALQVHTTLDLSAQEALEAAVAEQLPQQEDRPGVDAGAIAVDPATGAILALYGGRDFEQSQFDLATQARRRPGSTFKPFAFIAALEHDIEASDVYAAPARFEKGELCDPGWGPANAGGRGYGRLTLREGLINSVNTVLAQLGCDPGAEAIHGVARRFGLRSDVQVTPQISIGGVGTNATALDLADMYATLANDGVDCDVHAIAAVLDRDGNTLSTALGDRALPSELLDDRPVEWTEEDQPGCRRVADANDVRRTTAALEEVVERTTGKRAQIGRPQAGKTGTTDDEVDAWFAGYTPDLALVVRIGDREEVPLHEIAGFSKVQGGTIPALIWRDAAKRILKDVDPRGFPEPGENLEDGSVVGPARERPREADPTPSPSPSPSPSPLPSSDPSDPSDGGPSEGDDGGGGDGGDDDDCFIVIGDC